MRQASSVPRMPAELSRMPSISAGVESPAPDLFPTIAPPASVLEDGERDFDRKAASRVLKRAAMEARSCAEEGGPTGLTKVDVTFQPNGEVSAVQMTPDVVGTPAALCLYKVFGKEHVPPFAGVRAGACASALCLATRLPRGWAGRRPCGAAASGR
jgi:hypothetical protein